MCREINNIPKVFFLFLFSTAYFCSLKILYFGADETSSGECDCPGADNLSSNPGIHLRQKKKTPQSCLLISTRAEAPVASPTQ